VEQGEQYAEVAFLASPHLLNFAERLAHRFQGLSVNANKGSLRAQRLVVIADGLGLDAVRLHRARVVAESVEVVGIGVDAETLRWAYPETPVRCIASGPDETIWSRVEACVMGEGATDVGITKKPAIFVSHGVVDEPRIFPILETLRDKYGLTLFVCADSINPGSDWQQEIVEQLQRCDLFLALNSAATSRSVFCAYEAGMAAGLNKKTRVVSLDNSELPLHLRGIQAVDVPRLLARKPWLTESDGLLDACLWAVAAQPEECQ